MLSKIVPGTLALLFLAWPAQSQSPAFFGGFAYEDIYSADDYATESCDDLEATCKPLYGIELGVSYPLRPWLGVGARGGYARAEYGYGEFLEDFPAHTDWSRESAVGLVLRLPGNRVEPWLNFMLGVRQESSQFRDDDFQDLDTDIRGLTANSGVGVDVKFGPAWGVRVKAESIYFSASYLVPDIAYDPVLELLYIDDYRIVSGRDFVRFGLGVTYNLRARGVWSSGGGQ